MSMKDVAQAILDAGSVVENLHRIARGDGYCPTTAEERAETAIEAAAWETKLEALEDDLARLADAAVAEAGDDLDEMLSAQCDHVAEILAERAVYGDSGPGTGAVLMIAAALESAARRVSAGQRPFLGGAA